MGSFIRSGRLPLAGKAIRSTTTVAAVSAPANIVLPAISGTPTQGQTLSTSDGTWTGTATISYTYQWQADTLGNGTFADISGATSSTYTLTASEAGDDVRCQVTGTNGQGNSTANTVAVSVAASGSADVVANFGADTRAGAGGVAVTGSSISSGDASGHWQISGGFITPSVTGEDAITGTYNLTLNDSQTVDLTVVADALHVKADGTELAAACQWHETAADATARTIHVRAGDFTSNVSLTNYTLAAESARLTITAETPVNCLTHWQGTAINTATRTRFNNARLIVTNCDYFTVKGFEFSGDSSLAGLRMCQIETDPQAFIFQGNIVHGPAVDYTVNPTVTGDFIAPIGIGQGAGNNTMETDLTIKENFFYNLQSCISVRPTGTHCTIDDNVMAWCSQDFLLTAATSSNPTNTYIRRNVMYGPLSDYDNQSPKPHQDFMQFRKNGANVTLTGYVIEQNRLWCALHSEFVGSGTVRGENIEGIFADGAVSMVDPICRANAMMLNVGQQAFNWIVANGSQWYYNTVQSFVPVNEGQSEPRISVQNDAGGTHIFKGNISRLYNFEGHADTDTNNIKVYLSNNPGAPSYTAASVLTWDDTSPDTLAEFMATLTPLGTFTTTTSLPHVTGAIGGAYATFGANPFDSTGFSVNDNSAE